MTITINGESHQVPDAITIEALLGILNFSGKPVVVELDRHAISPSQHASTVIPTGATLQLVVLAAGG